MRVKLGLELWLVNGELVAPWVKFQNGKGAAGIADPRPVVIEKGTEVVLVMDSMGDPENIPYIDLRWDDDNAQLLAALGHKVPENVCDCGCKGCNTGLHCNDARCFPLS